MSSQTAGVQGLIENLSFCSLRQMFCLSMISYHIISASAKSQVRVFFENSQDIPNFFEIIHPNEFKCSMNTVCRGAALLIVQ